MKLWILAFAIPTKTQDCNSLLSISLLQNLFSSFCFNYMDIQEAVCYTDFELFPKINYYSILHTGKEIYKIW